MTEFNIPAPELNVKQNGVNKPKTDSFQGYVWAVADAIMAWRMAQSFEHTIPSSKEVRDAILAKLPDSKNQMISLGFSKWIKFHNLETMRGARALDERKSPAGLKAMSAEKLVERYSKLAMREIGARTRAEKAHALVSKVAGEFQRRGMDVPVITAPEAPAKPAKAAKVKQAA